MSHHDEIKKPSDPKPTAKGVQPEPATERDIPKPESSSEAEGAPSSKPTGNPPVAVKTETSSSSGE